MAKRIKKQSIDTSGERAARPAPHDDFWYISAPRSSFTGVTVDENSAMNYSAVFSCIRVIAEDLSSLPLITYERIGKGKERAFKHPLYRMLHDYPNPEMTSMQYREAAQVDVLSCGNHYSEIQRTEGGDPLALWPLQASRMTLIRNDQGELFYKYQLPNGEPKIFAKENILHVAGLGNGLVGKSPIKFAMQAIGLGLALEEYGARFFSGDGSIAGTIEHPGKLGPTGRENLRKAWDEAHGGLSMSHRLAILEEGAKFNKIGIPANEAQWLESRKFQKSEIAMIYRVQAHLINDLDRSTNNNIEHQGIEHVVYCIRPWAVRWEQQINLKLIRESERGIVFVEHLLDGLLRGDQASRYTAYGIAIDKGIMNPNECRALENMNPREGGDKYQETPPGGYPNINEKKAIPDPKVGE